MGLQDGGVVADVQMIGDPTQLGPRESVGRAPLEKVHSLVVLARPDQVEEAVAS